MDQPESRYVAFLVRLWCERADVYRVIVINPRTGERWGFGTLEDLLEFLRVQANERKAVSNDE